MKITIEHLGKSVVLDSDQGKHWNVAEFLSTFENDSLKVQSELCSLIEPISESLLDDKTAVPLTK